MEGNAKTSADKIVMHQLAKIVTWVWGIVTILFTIVLLGLLPHKGDLDMGLLMAFYGIISGIESGTVLASYFTSSIGSRSKDETIVNLTGK